MDYQSRLDRLFKEMESNELDGLIYGIGANFQYYTGFPVPWVREAEPLKPSCLLVLAVNQPPQMIVSAAYAGLSTTAPIVVHVVNSQTESTKILKQILSGTTSIGVSKTAREHLTQLVKGVLPRAKCVDAEVLGEKHRYCKDEQEVAQLRKLAELTDKAIAEVVMHIKPGVTQASLQSLLAKVGEDLGATGVSFPPTAGFVKSGTQPTEQPFVYPTEKGLVAGSSIAFDFGYIQNGYCSDFGRSFYCGPAPDHIAGAYKALQEAQCYLISRMKPGVNLGNLFGIIEQSLDELGYGDRLRARLSNGTLGHQIGVDLHENPWIRRGNDFSLRPGMVMCLEPKLWLPGDYYLRVEDMVLVTEGGAESLTSFDRELFELPL